MYLKSFYFTNIASEYFKTYLLTTLLNTSEIFGACRNVVQYYKRLQRDGKKGKLKKES